MSKFIVIQHGDLDVGIYSQKHEVVLPNPGLDNDEWEEIAKETLKELYDDGAKVSVFTKEEYEKEIDRNFTEEF